MDIRATKSPRFLLFQILFLWQAVCLQEHTQLEICQSTNDKTIYVAKDKQEIIAYWKSFLTFMFTFMYNINLFLA